MGAFDDIEASRPRSPVFNMLGRGVGDARRKITLIVLLGCFLIISLVAFRRQEQIKDIIQDQTNQWSNVTVHETKPVTKPAEPSLEEQGGRTVTPADKPSTTAEKSKTPLSEKKPVAPGPELGDRSLPDANLIALRNETLGVCSPETLPF